jgi:hypothetical protein
MALKRLGVQDEARLGYLNDLAMAIGTQNERDREAMSEGSRNE